MSLDVFRGATIAAMILVNNPGTWSAIYKPLEHAEWHGWTFTDLIFPFFLWIVGVAIPLSTARRLEQGQSRRQLLLHALRRSVIIFALGFFLNSFSLLLDGSLWRDGLSAWWQNYATTVRVPGVLAAHRDLLLHRDADFPAHRHPGADHLDRGLAGRLLAADDRGAAAWLRHRRPGAAWQFLGVH